MTSTAPTFREALRFWLKLGLISFGGPSGQIAIMHTELVENKKWISEERFLHALNFCMLLPGPEATQLATYCGWLLHRTWGGITAGVLFVLPSALLLWLLSFVYVMYGQVAWLGAAFNGLKPAVTAIVFAAVWHIGKRALKRSFHWGIAGAAFVSLFAFHAPFPAVVAAAALLGLLFKPEQVEAPIAAKSALSESPSSLKHTLTVLAVSIALWWTPVLIAGLYQGWSGTLAQQGLFFSKAALVTFGGAYAVLPYVGQQAVENHGWLTASQMLDGLGLAETTPGPLIMVLQFVGFLGGWNKPGGLSPLTAATLGAAMTTWTTFVPSFLFIFAGAPYIERLRHVAWLNHALSAVTAAVVGVILNLAVWFGGHVFFPSQGQINWYAVVLATVAFFAIHRFKVSLLVVIAGCAVLSIGRYFILR
jgi:chromate transporter